MERIPIRSLRKKDLDALYDRLESLENEVVRAKNKESMVRIEKGMLEKENISLRAELSRLTRLSNALRRSVNME
ncbi:hypothetical protein [uncultured Duncaniella sp.]|uniref:hypothetical protein n=1 Tax=uncultured Duncaniella sp. TaxID=2768039 RepID=UPI002608DAEB|nr:hypothetical protein [uncultured Duncaniella sp.]